MVQYHRYLNNPLKTLDVDLIGLTYTISWERYV